MASIQIGPNIDEISDSIRDPESKGPMRKAVGFLGRQICDAIGAVEGWVNDAGIPVKDFIPACRPYWDERGESGPIAQPPFTGGQCPGVRYTVTGTFLNNTTGSSCGLTQNWTAGNPFGPINGVVADGPFWNLSTAGGPIAINRTSADGGGRLGVGNPPCAGSPGSNIQRASNVVITSVVPVSGGANNCGDPPPRIVPGPNPTPTPPTPLPPDKRPFNDPVGGPSIPIPTIPTIPGLPDLPGFDPFGSADGDGDGGPPPGDIGSPGSPGDTGEGGDTEGEAPPNSVLVGVKVDILAFPDTASKYDPEVWRGACYVYMGVPGNLALDTSGVALRGGQFFYAYPDNLTAWRVSANMGFTLRVTPYYRTLEPELV